MADDDESSLLPPLPSDTADTSNIPKTIRRPADTPNNEPSLDEQEEELRKQQAYAAEQQANLIKRQHELDEKYRTKAEPYLNQINENLANLQSTDPRTITPLTAEYQKALQQNAQQHGSSMFETLFTLLGIGAVVFGKHRGWGARAGIQNGIGLALYNYGQGKKEAAVENQSHALRLIQLMREENSERHQQQMEILQNKRLTIQQQMDMFKTHREIYQDEDHQNQEQLKTIEGITKNLHQKEQALIAMQRLKLKVGNDLSNMFKSKDARAWADYMRTVYHINPQKDEKTLAEAEQEYPYEQFILDYKEAGKTDEKTGKEKTLKAPEKPAPEDDLKKKTREFGESLFGTK